MKIKKTILFSCVLLVFFCSSIYFTRTNSNFNYSNKQGSITIDDDINTENLAPKLASQSNNEIIESIFTYKIDEYSNLSYYSQIYESIYLRGSINDSLILHFIFYCILILDIISSDIFLRLIFY